MPFRRLGLSAFVVILTAGSLATGGDGGPRVESEASTTIVRIAICQILCIEGDAEGNFRRVECAVDDAAAAGAEIACLPECAILGWLSPNALDRAETIPGPTTERLSALALRNRVMICIGMAEKDRTKLYDSAILVGADGAVLLKQRKIDNQAGLVPAEPRYAQGDLDDVRVASTPLGRIGIAICADSFHEELMTRIGRASPDLLLIPFGLVAVRERWPRYGEVLARKVAQAAERVGCPAVGINCVGVVGRGSWAGRVYGGQSAVADCGGKILGVLKDRDAEVRVFDVPIRQRVP